MGKRARVSRDILNMAWGGLVVTWKYRYWNNTDCNGNVCIVRQLKEGGPLQAVEYLYNRNEV